MGNDSQPLVELHDDDPRESTTAMSYADGRAALSSPLGVGMLLLLLANDHLFKGSGVFPNWLTGKLSDFAGLVVAPLVAVWLLRARDKRIQGGVFIAIAALFASVKLSAFAASALITALASFGVSWRIVVDPTDLVALVAMPIGWWLLQRRRPQGSRTVAMAAAVACIASGEPDEPARWNTTTYLVNDTGAAMEVRLRYYEGSLDCDAVWTQLDRALDRSAFGEGIQFRLEAFDTLPLVRNDVLAAAGLTDPWSDTSSELPAPMSCELVLVQADGLPDIVAWWQGGAVVSVPLRSDDKAFEDNEALIDGRIDLIRNEAGVLEMHARGSVVLTKLSRNIEPSACMPGALRFQWSETTVGGPTNHVIEAVRLLPDGCLEIDVAADASYHDDVFLLCIPASAFPFQAGDSITVLAGGDSLEMWEMGSPRTLHVYSGVTSGMRLGDLDITLQPGDCTGDRSVCGAYLRPASLRLTESGQVLNPGDDIGLANGARIFLGRAEQVMAAPIGCERGRNQTGLLADVAVVHTGEETP